MDSLAFVFCFVFAGLFTGSQQFTYRTHWTQRFAPPPVVVPTVVPPPVFVPGAIPPPGPPYNAPLWRSFIPPGQPALLPSQCQPCPCTNNLVPTLSPGGIPINYHPGFNGVDGLNPFAPTPMIENPDPNNIGISFGPNPTNMMPIPDQGLNFGCANGFSPSCNPMFAHNGGWPGANGVNIGMNPALLPQDGFHPGYPNGYGLPDYQNGYDSLRFGNNGMIGNGFEGPTPFGIQPGFNDNGFGNGMPFDNGYGSNCFKICSGSLANRFSYGFKSVNGLTPGFDAGGNFGPPNLGLVGQPYGSVPTGFDYNNANGFQYGQPYGLSGPFGAGNVSGFPFPTNFSLRKAGEGQSDESTSSLTGSGVDVAARKIEERSANTDSQKHSGIREKLFVVKAPKGFRLLQDRNEQ